MTYEYPVNYRVHFIKIYPSQIFHFGFKNGLFFCKSFQFWRCVRIKIWVNLKTILYSRKTKTIFTFGTFKWIVWLWLKETESVSCDNQWICFVLFWSLIFVNAIDTKWLSVSVRCFMSTKMKLGFEIYFLIIIFLLFFLPFFYFSLFLFIFWLLHFSLFYNSYMHPNIYYSHTL